MAQLDEKLEVFYEATPNPEAMKFYWGKNLATETQFFDDPLKAQPRSPLATKIFGFPWAQAVMVGPNFVTVTKQDWVEWKVLAQPLSGLIQEHINGDEPILVEVAEKDPSDDKNAIKDDDSEIIKKIKTIINQEVRPAVAMDGGDIIFNRYEDSKLYLELHGACNGCPSAAVTLKQGIEVRIQQAIPEVTEVLEA